MVIFGKFYNFATDSVFPKRKTFRNKKTKKLSKTENFGRQKGNIINNIYGN